jgi:NADH dehydrogenase
VLAAYPEDLSAKAEAALKARRRSPHQYQVTSVGPGWVEAQGNGAMHSTPWSRCGPPACRPRRWARCWARPTSRPPRLRLVDDRLNPPGLPNVFVLGDLAHFEQDGHQVPGVAQPAMQMGDHVAKMIAADLAGKPRPLPLLRQGRHGHHRPHGRRGQGRVALQGAHERLSRLGTWLTVHIFFLIGFRNRLSVFAAWAWTYFTFTRARGSSPATRRLPGWTEHSRRPARTTKRRPSWKRRAP